MLRVWTSPHIEKKYTIDNFDEEDNMFGQQIDEITNGQFFTEVARDKNYAIFKIADYLYKKKLNEK